MFCGKGAFMNNRQVGLTLLPFVMTPFQGFIEQVVICLQR